MTLVGGGIKARGKSKFDFPHFSGGDLYEWLDKVGRYFQVYEVARADKVPIASLYLDGRANSWWRWLKVQYYQDHRCMGWTNQCGPSPAMDHHGQLVKLRQEGKIQTYIDEFLRLQTMTGGGRRPIW
ncbi:hypothetical protein ACOSQ2_004168 [Xanthoceras sorbifolium]